MNIYTCPLCERREETPNIKSSENEIAFNCFSCGMELKTFRTGRKTSRLVNNGFRAWLKSEGAL